MERIPVVILCGGRGTRMGQETDWIPKPMVRIAGEQPILWHIMKGYAAAGFADFILCLGYQGDVIRSYFLNYGTSTSDFTVTLGSKRSVVLHDPPQEAWQVTLAETGLHTMTGARIKQIEKYVEGHEVFMLTYGDGVADIDFAKLLAFHRAHGKLATVTGVRPPARFGQLRTDGDLVNAFMEKPEPASGEAYINGGFFVLQHEALELLGTDPDCMFEREPLQRLADRCELAIFRHEGFWQCMDTVRDLETLSHLWTSGNAPWKTWG